MTRARTVMCQNTRVAESIDYEFLRRAIEGGFVGESVVEIGGRSWQGDAGNAETICRQNGIAWTAVDLEPGPGVEHVLDILDLESVDHVGRQWPTALLFNLLEHVYDPALALRNSLRLVQPGGTCLIVVPTLWQIHDYPADYWRPMPDFFLEFGRRNGVEVVGDMLWLYNWRMQPINELTVNGQKKLPDEWENSNLTYGRWKSRFSWLVQKGLNTTGRYTPYPKLALALIMRNHE